jgi:hypothetical protein
MTENQIEKFNRILDLEQEVRVTRAQVVFASNFTERYDTKRKAGAALDKLYAAIEALTPRELDEFAVHRGHATRGLTS